MAVTHYNSGEGPIVARGGGYGQAKSIASIIAIIAAIASFFVNSGLLGLGLAVVAIVLGLVGFIKAASPRVSGGIISLIAIGLGLIAALFAVLRGLLHLF